VDVIVELILDKSSVIDIVKGMKKIFFLIAIILFLTGCVYGSEFDAMVHEDWQKFTSVDCASTAAPHAQTDRNLLYEFPTTYHCVRAFDRDICGYDCKIANGIIRCANFPSQRCIIGGSGYIACGYDCKRSAIQARCGIRYGDTCVEDRFGHIICGLNCSIIAGKIICEPSPTFRERFPEGRLYAPWPGCSNPTECLGNNH
jgi:hypothetical protein